jgi:hypothetical protein
MTAFKRRYKVDDFSTLGTGKIIVGSKKPLTLETIRSEMNAQ